MRQRFAKKLVLNKVTVATLESKEMIDIQGGTIIKTDFLCTDKSCSAIRPCCDTTDPKVLLVNKETDNLRA